MHAVRYQSRKGLSLTQAGVQMAPRVSQSEKKKNAEQVRANRMSHVAGEQRCSPWIGQQKTHAVRYKSRKGVSLTQAGVQKAPRVSQSEKSECNTGTH